jgi:hypothetical protein
VGAGVHGERPPDRRGDAHQALDPAQPDGSGFADHRRQTRAAADRDLFAVELHAAKAALDLQHDAPIAAVPHQRVVSAPQDGDGQLLLVGEHQRLPDVVDVLRNDEDVRRPATAERRVERERLLEAHLAVDLT